LEIIKDIAKYVVAYGKSGSLNLTIASRILALINNAEQIIINKYVDFA
jgi:hypothetical protein